MLPIGPTIIRLLLICNLAIVASVQHAGAGVGVPALAGAASVTIGSVAETTVQSAFPGNNYGDGSTFTSGGRRQGGVTRGLLRFDVAGNVPAGATINSVSLTLNVVSAPSGAPSSVFDLRLLTVSWGEGNNADHRGSPADPGEATWNSRFSGSSSWTTPGGDFAGVVSASRSIAGSGGYTFSSTASLLSDVQGWLNTPADNFGWILMSETENTATTIRRFGSHELGAQGPQLSISYTPVPEPGTWALLMLGFAGFAWMRRRRN